MNDCIKTLEKTKASMCAFLFSCFLLSPKSPNSFSSCLTHLHSLFKYYSLIYSYFKKNQEVKNHMTICLIWNFLWQLKYLWILESTSFSQSFCFTFLSSLLLNLGRNFKDATDIFEESYGNWIWIALFTKPWIQDLTKLKKQMTLPLLLVQKGSGTVLHLQYR